MTGLHKIFKRHLARLLTHYADTGQLTQRLTSDTKRNYGYLAEDVERFIDKGYCKKGVDDEKRD